MSHRPLGAFLDPYAAQSERETGQVEVQPIIQRPPEPGEDYSGPALTHLVAETMRSMQALANLQLQARRAGQERYVSGVVAGQTDSGGDFALKVLDIPGGATAHLMLAAIDMAGVNPGSPVTSATLWHGIYRGQGGGDMTLAQVVAVGNLLDCQPLTPASDAQVPYVYTYGDRYSAPTLVGPASFWVVADGLTAARQVAVRYGVLICSTEP